MMITVDANLIAQKLVARGITNTPWSGRLKSSHNWIESLVEVLEETYDLEYEVAKYIESTKKENNIA